MRFFFVFILFIGFISNAQQIDVVDFLKVEAEITPLSLIKEVKANVTYTFQAKKNTDSIFLDAIRMRITEVDSKYISVTSEENKIWFTGSFETDLIYTVSFSYEAAPKQTLYFTEDQIWTQGQGKYTSHWLPSIDDMNDKIEFDLTINSEKNKTVIANGNLVSKKELDTLTSWQFNMKKEMSSYLVAFVVGEFDKMSIQSSSGIPIELYFRPSDALKEEPTYRFTKEIFDFLEDEIGVAYPWQNYKQVPVRDFLYAGMENTTATIFSEAFVVDSIGFKDRNYVNVNAHELAHQWFGNLITETSGDHHWLQEGFATFYALLAEKEMFGEEYYYWKLLQTAEQLQSLSDNGKGESLLNPKASSLTFYEKGAWALHMLREQVGVTVFNEGIKNYLNKYQFKNVTTEDFLTEMRLVSNQDLESFEEDWLQQSAFKAELAYKSLIKSPFILDYLEISALQGIALSEKKEQLKSALTFPNDYIGQEAINQLAGEPITETLALYIKGFESNNVMVRQVISGSLTTIPKELKTYYETLLKDESYVTQETAFYYLWFNFPDDREVYLETMKNTQGFQNKNIRQLWLVLAIVTEDYKKEEKKNYIEELQNYTSPTYSFEIRELALNYIQDLSIWNTSSVRSLVNACLHHNWRFSKNAKKIFSENLKNESFKKQVLSLFDVFNEKEKNVINKLLTS
ncbi:MAG: M1 family metallopeptidase [Flavobacteriaceae bacterium]|nr:M1 family metallopeptidase [Flavobacteriaceae bacterium]